MATFPLQRPTWRIDFGRRTQLQALLLTAAFVAVFFNVLRDLWYTWTHSSDWSHGPIIPLFSIYLAYLRWDKIRSSPIRQTGVGLALLLAGLVGYQYFVWVLPMTSGQQSMMLLSLLGVLLFLCGLPVWRHVLIPWLYLFFAIPLPSDIYYRLTDPLRRLAAIVAVGVLQMLPQLDDIQRLGSTIHYVYKGEPGVIGVADACSGMRSTITLCALGVAVAFMSNRPTWQRVVMIASCVPIAIFTNFIRVTVTCLLYVFVDPKYAGGEYHMTLGLVTLLIAFGMFTGLGWILNHILVEGDEPVATAGQIARHG